MRIWPGSSYPLGAAWDGKGVNFAIYSENATSISLLLYESQNSPTPRHRIPLTEKSGYVWHCYLPDIMPGQLYAYSVDGPYEPDKGLRFNKKKALIDPYSRAITGTIPTNDAMFGHKLGDPTQDLSRDERDSGPFSPKSLIIDSRYDWEGDSLLRTPWNETVIYETHVKGFTKLHPGIPRKKEALMLDSLLRKSFAT